MSWKTLDPRTNTQTNVPDYEKMLQGPHYSSWGESEDNVHPVRSHSPPLSQHYPENTTHEPRIYQPSKYSVVSGSGRGYDPTYREYDPPTREGTVQYLSSDGYEKLGHKSDYSYKPLTSYQNDLPRAVPSYSAGNPYRTLPMRSNPNDAVYRTPVKSSIHEDRNLLPSQGYVHHDDRGNAPGQGYVHRDDRTNTSLHSGSNLRHSTGDLRHWQQLHQEQLLHQHIETQALYDKPASLSIDNLFKQLSLKEEDATRWEPIRRAADGIIQEKNMIIEKLKNRILQLEEDCSLNETRLKHALINKDDHQTDSLHQKMQELQYKYATLKTELIDTRSQKNVEIDELEVKLGAAEYELDQLKKTMKNRETSSTDLQLQLQEKDREVKEWQTKFTEMKDSSLELKRKLDSLEQYLGDLPTSEETTKTAKESEQLKEEMSLKDTKIQELERKLNHVRKVVSHKEFQHREILEKDKHLKEKLKAVMEENDRLKMDDTTAALFKAQEELREVRDEKERFAIDLEKAKKLLEDTHRKLRQQEVKYQAELRQVTERVTQEEEAVEILRQEIGKKDEQVLKMKRAMKQLNTQHQDLLEQNLILKEELKQYEMKCTDENLKLQRRLMRELGLCFTELQSVVQVCMQKARGEEPNLAILLQVTDPSDDSLGGMTEEDLEKQTVAQWISKIKELRVEVDRIRNFLKDKYSEDMAWNNCTTQ